MGFDSSFGSTNFSQDTNNLGEAAFNQAPSQTSGDIKNKSSRQKSAGDNASEDSALNYFNMISKQKDSALFARDTFFRWRALDSKDFNLQYGYEWVIQDISTGRVINRLVMPLNPENISVNVPAAVSLVTTMKGIVEDSNGAPLRQISVSGTSGVLHSGNPFASSSRGELENTVRYMFRNTIKSVNNVLAQGSSLVQAFNGNQQKFTGPLNYKDTEIKSEMTGFNYFHNMIRMFDHYLAAKKQARNKNWRLIFQMFKDGAFYVCTLNGYSYNKVAGTVEYRYNINLTAWQRLPDPVNNLQAPVRAGRIGSQEKISKLNAIINSIRQARTLLASVHGVMAGIRADLYQSFVVPVGETYLLAKDAIGLATSMYDFVIGKQLISGLQEEFKSYFRDNPSQSGSVDSAITSLGLVSASAPGKNNSALTNSIQDKEASGKADANGPVGDSADPLTNLFAKPEDHPEIFDSVQTDALNIPQAVQNQMDLQLDRIRALTADDIRTRRDTVAAFNGSISEALGGGNATYNRIYGLGPPKKTFKQLDTDDIALLNNMNDILLAMDGMVTLLDSVDEQVGEDYYSFYADYAVAEELVFNSNNVSKFFVPFPFGASLDSLALQYLGDSERWLEIAALNALKPPYIDEEGYDISIIGSSGGNTLTVADPASLYIGQIIVVRSKMLSDVLRKVREIDVVSEAETLITFEDATDNVKLTSYKPTDGAVIHATMPNTVNSNMLVAIPSESQVSIQTSLKTTPGIADLNGLARLAQVDFLLDKNGDLIFDSAGNFQLAMGVTNLLQAALMKIVTKAKTMVQHPEFGNAVEPGTPTSDVNPKELVENLNLVFNEDPRFDGILAAEVSKNGPTASLKVLVKIANTNIAFPLQAQVPL